MEGAKAHPATIDEYIAQFPEDVQRILQQVRAVIKESAPEAVEMISYQMPAFFQAGILVWFAGYRRHIGFYPKGSGIEAFKERLTAYKSAKGSVQFPLDKPMPFDLIREIVKFRIADNQRAAGLKKKTPAKEHTSPQDAAG